jgi:signal transduction histidine kinase
MALSKVWLDGQRLLTAVLRDLTHERMLQCELAQAQKLEAVGQLAAGIAHEINTPTQYVGDNTRFLKEAFDDIRTVLESFAGLLSAAKDGAVTPDLVAQVESKLVELDLDYLREEIPQAIAQSLEGVGRVAKIVRAMREFSHPGSDEKSFIDLRDAIETTLTVARNEWKYVAEVETQFDPELPEVPCLPGELNQVILNLVVNASHAIADVLGQRPTEKGTITIGTRREGDDWAVFFVQDTGTGIPEKIRAKIFDPFFTTKEVGKGTGQGLAIARSVVVDKHGGAIDCETSTGRGTTFTVRLPLEAQGVAKSQET